MVRTSVIGVMLALVLGATGQAGTASPWFGTWSLRAEDAGGEPETLVYSDAGDGAMRMESVEAGSVIVTRFDGEPVTDTGPSHSGNALAVKVTSSTSYDWIFWKDDKPFVQGHNTLSDDRQSFTEVSWRIDAPERKVTLIYQRR